MNIQDWVSELIEHDLKIFNLMAWRASLLATSVGFAAGLYMVWGFWGLSGLVAVYVLVLLGTEYRQRELNRPFTFERQPHSIPRGLWRSLLTFATVLTVLNVLLAFFVALLFPDNWVRHTVVVLYVLELLFFRYKIHVIRMKPNQPFGDEAMRAVLADNSEENVRRLVEEDHTRFFRRELPWNDVVLKLPQSWRLEGDKLVRDVVVEDWVTEVLELSGLTDGVEEARDFLRATVRRPLHVHTPQGTQICAPEEEGGVLHHEIPLDIFVTFVRTHVEIFRHVGGEVVDEDELYPSPIEE